IVSLQRRQQAHDNARARGPYGVAQRTCASVYVYLFMWQTEIVHRCHRNHRESFVDLEEINVFEVPSDAFGQSTYRSNWSGWKLMRRIGMRRMAHDNGAGTIPVFFCERTSC